MPFTAPNGANTWKTTMLMAPMRRRRAHRREPVLSLADMISQMGKRLALLL